MRYCYFYMQSMLCRGFRVCGRDKGAMETDECLRSPLDPFAVASHVTWFLSLQGRQKGKQWFFTESWGKSSLGARLRTRKVRSRDASLPAPLLTASLGLVGLGTVGALPQTPQGTLSLAPARGRRKGTKSPLDPFSRLGWSHFHASSACSFLVLRLSPCLLPPTFREEPFLL